MIAKIKRNSSIEGTVFYNLKDHAQLIDTHNLPGDSIDDYIKLMKLRMEKFKGRAANKIAHCIISPSIEDGKTLSLEQWKDLGHRYLSRMELENHQSICFIHEDKKHIHLHIVTNRINEKGKIYRPYANEIVLSQRAGREIAKELGLKQARDLSRGAELQEGLFSDLKKDLNVMIEKFLKNEKTFNAERYLQNLELNGYGVKRYVNIKTGTIYGYAIEKNGNYFKSSALGKEFSIPNLEERFSKNAPDLKEKIKEDLLKLIELSRGEENEFDNEFFFSNIKSLGYEVRVHYKKDADGTGGGEIHGYSIGVDSHFYRASDIGKEFTLINLKKQKKEAVSAKSFIEIEKITNELKDLTSGHRYSSKEEFIRSLENTRFKVHMRYKNGEPVGYAIGVGRRSYPDNIINNGLFSFDKLKEKGVLKEADHYTYPKRKPLSSLIEAVDDVMKKRIAANLQNTITSYLDSGQSFETKKFFNKLNDLGYEIKPFYKQGTNELRGYAIGIGGVFYNASDIGKEFSLKAISTFLSGEMKNTSDTSFSTSGKKGKLKTQNKRL